VLSALSITVGIAAVVGVLGLTTSSQSALLAEIDRLGTNLLTVTNGQSVTGQEVELPAQAAGMISRAGGVLHVAPTAEFSSFPVFRTNVPPTYQTNGLDLRACDPALLAALGGTVLHGTSTARRAGHWQVQPSRSRGTTQVWACEYRVPVTRSITPATRASVHISVGTRSPSARPPAPPPPAQADPRSACGTARPGQPAPALLLPGPGASGTAIDCQAPSLVAR
jgi:hypothetical protein